MLQQHMAAGERIERGGKTKRIAELFHVKHRRGSVCVNVSRETLGIVARCEGDAPLSQAVKSFFAHCVSGGRFFARCAGGAFFAHCVSGDVFLPAARAVTFAPHISFSPAEKKKRRRRFASGGNYFRAPRGNANAPHISFSLPEKETRRARCKEKRAWCGFAMTRSLLLEKCLIILCSAEWRIVRMRLRISAADAHERSVENKSILPT